MSWEEIIMECYPCGHFYVAAEGPILIVDVQHPAQSSGFHTFANVVHVWPEVQSAKRLRVAINQCSTFSLSPKFISERTNLSTLTVSFCWRF